MFDTPSRSRPTDRLRWLTALAFVLALAAAIWRLPGASAPPALAALPPLPAMPASGLLSQEMLPGVGSTAASPSLTRLADGRIAIAWHSAATSARQQDAIWFSVFEHGTWRQPYPLSNTEEAAGSLFAHIRQLAEPLLFQHGSSLHLWFTVSAAGGRSIVHTRSDDGGEHWQGLARVAASPLANTDLRLHHPPLALSDGGLLLPISQTWLGGRRETLQLNGEGRVVDKSRRPIAAPAFDPAALAIDARQPLAILRLPDGRLLLAGNAGQGRRTLGLWIGQADGSAWRGLRLIETASDALADFSEPSLAIDGNGRIHLAYAWRQQGIRHLVFGAAWVDGEQP